MKGIKFCTQEEKLRKESVVFSIAVSTRYLQVIVIEIITYCSLATHTTLTIVCSLKCVDVFFKVSQAQKNLCYIK